MAKRIFVFANMGHLDRLPKSGGQTSARRVMDGFRQEGFEVIPIRRHRAELQSRMGHILEVGWFAVYDLFKIVGKMAFRSRKDAIFMHLTYAGPLVPYEFLLTLTTRLLGFRNVEYLQGGLVMETYPKGRVLHRWMYAKNMKMQEMVLFEGMDALRLTPKEVVNPRLIYFPSYIFDSLIPSSAPQKPTDEINLCYFGRIVKQKNVLSIIEAFNQLCQRMPDKKISLTIVGSGENRPYLELVSAAIAQSAYAARIERYENSPYEFLVQMMQRQHFYLFPTQTRAEGHSNALNEAMSQGVIPIASDFHFNRSVIGDDRCIVRGYDPKDYAERIARLVEAGAVPELSAQMWHRVKENFAYSVVNRTICDELRKI